ncbi:hypothetical protein [Spongorhabdus nitratireducens]
MKVSKTKALLFYGAITRITMQIMASCHISYFLYYYFSLHRHF